MRKVLCPMATHSESDPKVLLAELLRAARQQSQFPTQEALARAIGKERSAVSKPEQGERVPAVDVLDDILAACEVTGLARFAIEGVARLARAWEDPASAQLAVLWYPTEARAHTLRYWNPTLIPGPFQTSAYATELFRAMGFPAAKVSESLEIRLRRQDIFTRANPPDTTIVLWEPVLHHQIGTHEVMRDQCVRLLEVSQLPTVNLHILPSSLGANPGLGGAINLAAADDAPELLCGDGLVEDQLSQEPAAVHKARTTMSNVRADALNRVDSRARISEAMEIWSNR
jgi:transcriptional regulator with XRE-family HTH domain